MNGHIPASLDAPQVTPEQTEPWVAFITAMDHRYASLARREGRPYTRHTPEELRAVAELAAALGIQPDGTSGRARARWTHPARRRPRAREVTGVAY